MGGGSEKGTEMALERRRARRVRRRATCARRVFLLTTMSNGDKFSTPLHSSSRLLSSITRSSAIKRDSLQAELERGEWRSQRTRGSDAHHVGVGRPTAFDCQKAAADTSLLLSHGTCLAREATRGGTDGKARTRDQATRKGASRGETRRRQTMAGGARGSREGGKGT